MRYALPKDVRTLFSQPEGKATKTNFVRIGDELMFCNIVERRVVNGETRYRIRISMTNGEIKEGWTPGGGLDPVVYDPNNELLDGRFNL